MKELEIVISGSFLLYLSELRHIIVSALQRGQNMNSFQLYKDIEARTNGEIYIGVVGPVRTGKSTFIKRFMDVMVLPKMEDEHVKIRTKDELPQSASGRVIMTTEPKFVPKEAAEIQLSEDTKAKVRLIDCVGYMVEGAAGHVDGNEERRVKTPWFDYEIPFTQAAEIGTRKVIHEHATIGVVVTTDGTICGIERKNYKEAEGKTIRELQAIGKPFVVLVNTKNPYGEEAALTVKEIKKEYDVNAISVDCEQLTIEDIYRILKAVLFAFPISEIQFFVPKWVEMLSGEHEIKKNLLSNIRELLDKMNLLSDAAEELKNPESKYIEKWEVENIQPDKGTITIKIEVPENYYYEMLSNLSGVEMHNQYELIATIKNLSVMKAEYESVKDAFSDVKLHGYGVVSPKRAEIELLEPEIIKQGNKYGVKIHSQAPSIHLIRANIETDIAPIVGSEQQANDLIQYIKEMSETEDGIWGTNIFGKSVEALVMDGIRNKIVMINKESQEKLQDTMQKIVNDSNGGLVCIII